MSDLTAEMTAQYGPNGPVARAQEWLKKVLIERDFSAAWALMTPENRLDFAQRWLWANRAHPLMVGRSGLLKVRLSPDLWGREPSLEGRRSLAGC